MLTGIFVVNPRSECFVIVTVPGCARAGANGNPSDIRTDVTSTAKHMRAEVRSFKTAPSVVDWMLDASGANGSIEAVRTQSVG